MAGERGERQIAKRVVSSTLEAKTVPAADDTQNNLTFLHPTAASSALPASTCCHRQSALLHQNLPTHLALAAFICYLLRHDTLFNSYWQCHSAYPPTCRPNARRRPRTQARVNLHRNLRRLLVLLAGRGEPAMPPVCSLKGPPAVMAH